MRYGRWLAVFLTTDHLVSSTTTSAVARIRVDRRMTIPAG